MRWKLFCWFLILQICQQCGWTKDDLPEVDCPLGKVRGFWKESLDKRNYAAFEGIPYAEPPIGDLRFEEPLPASPWIGIWEANNLHTCLQGGDFLYGQFIEEDCLYLNVYVPAEFLNACKKQDVVVVVHGGAFMMGSGHMTDPGTMMDRNIILVTLNYRIGIFVFWKRLEYVDENWRDIACFVLDYNDTLPDPTKDHIADNLSEYYLGAGEGINKKNFRKFTQMCTDRMFASPVELAARMQAKVMKSPVYVYIFDFHGSEQKMAYFLSQSDDLDGVAHGEDGQYFYGFNVSNEQEIRLKNACQDILYSFATTGVPSIDGTDSWQPTGSTELTYLNITGPDNMKMQTIVNYTPLDFWAKLGLRENEYFVHN